MAANAWKLLLVSFLLQSVVRCENTFKSSLVFVIDDTYSMGRVINDVKRHANQIFDTVMNSEYSQIENFVLVTFNDPGVGKPVVFTDRYKFKQGLRNIRVHGGHDCPEYSLSGIKLALEASLPRSNLYVFTDASAKDYYKEEEVKTLALEKSSQIDFILTGRCDGNSSGQVPYENLAKVTSGQVFYTWENNIDQILKYVQEVIRGRMVELAKADFPPGPNNKLDFNMDEYTGKVHISATGRWPTIDVTGPEGYKPRKTDVVREKEVSVVMIESTKTGLHTATIGSTSNTNVIVKGRTTIDFQHGFSTSTPTTIKESTLKPQPDVKSHLLIDLNVLKGEDVKLTKVQLLDVNGNVLLEKSLEEINTIERLYATTPFEPPKQLFRILVFGYIVANNNVVKRLAATYIEQESARPQIVLENGKTKYTASESDRVLRIPCRSLGYPKPTIAWTVDQKPISAGSKYAFEEGALIVRPPVISDTHNYTCIASNKLGEDRKTFEGIVEDKITSYDNVKKIYKLKGATFELKCLVPHTESDTVTWFHDPEPTNGTKPHSNTLYLLDTKVSENGNYSCRVSNDHGYAMDTYEVIFGSPPTFKAYQDEITNWNGAGTLDCTVDAEPSPTIQWLYEGVPVMSNDDQLTITAWGQYNCNVTNVFGSVQRSFNVTSSDCLIHKRTEEEYEKNKLPIMLSENRTWIYSEIINDFLVIPNQKEIILSCHSLDSEHTSFKILPGTDEIRASCIGQDRFSVNGTIYKHHDLQCNIPIVPLLYRLKGQCLNENTKMTRVHYANKEIYRVCFDEALRVPLYSRVTNFNYNKVSLTVPYLYDLSKNTSESRNSNFCKQSSSTCCLVETQLVKPSVVAFGAPQRATYIKLYTVAFWQSCDNSRFNWSSIEELLQDTDAVTLWSGASEYSEQEKVMVPRYLWKVVTFSDGDSLAIVYVNEPTPNDSQVLCQTVCLPGQISWISSNDKYTYCCKLSDFIPAFNLTADVFEL